jgi:hypothetical protein
MPGRIKFARGVRRKPGEMNKLEEKMAAELDLLCKSGKVLKWWFEGITLRLAKATRYTPDFLVMLPDGTIECWEVKGHWEDDARVKIKVAAEMFPMRFKAFSPKPKRDGGGWKIEEFGGDVDEC